MNWEPDSATTKPRKSMAVCLNGSKREGMFMRDWHTVPGKFIPLFVCLIACHTDYMEDKAAHFCNATNSQLWSTEKNNSTTVCLN